MEYQLCFAKAGNELGWFIMQCFTNLAAGSFGVDSKSDIVNIDFSLMQLLSQQSLPKVAHM